MANKQRLIDADELKKWLKSPVGFRANCEDCTSIDCLDCIIEEAIDNANTIEATPVVHGRWVFEKNPNTADTWNYRCTACDGYNGDDPAFCPNCGAKMDGG